VSEERFFERSIFFGLTTSNSVRKYDNFVVELPINVCNPFQYNVRIDICTSIRYEHDHLFCNIEVFILARVYTR